jgi:hypothetical protein
MKRIAHKIKLVGAACALATGLGVGVTAVTAVPAFAANGPCYDVTNSQPTPLHYVPSASSQTIKQLSNNDTVTGTCIFYDNVNENRWYMQVNYIGPGNDNGYGYIWVQRLDYGKGHTCKYNSGQVFSIGSDYCPIYTY